MRVRSRGIGWWEGYFTLQPRHLIWYGVVLAAILVVAAIGGAEVGPSSVARLLVAEAAIGTMWVFARQGASRAAAILVVASFWLVIATATAGAGGFAPINYLTFGVVVVIAALLLGGGAAILVAALTLGLGAIIPPGDFGLGSTLPLPVRAGMGYTVVILFLMMAQQAMRDAVLRHAESLSLLRATLESTADGILVTDMQGRVTGHNRKFLELWRMQADQVADGAVEHLAAAVRDQVKDPDAFEENTRRLYLRLDEVAMDMVEFRDGRAYERYSQPQRLDGRTVGRVCSYRDVTERRQAEAAKGRLEGELFQAQKMEALGRLAGGIAHDFNNILTAIVSHTEIAKIDSEGQPALVESLDEVLRAAYRARDLVGQILVFSRTRAHERIPIRLLAPVEETLRLLHSTLPKSIALELVPPGQDETVFADPTQVHQVVMNLVVNSAHAIGERNGRIVVRLAPISVGPGPVVPAPGLQVGRYMALSVEDDGAGMDAPTLARIYEPFFSTKAPGKGTGLGLAMVHSIMRNHHGGIGVESAPGQGTTFRAFFPVHQMGQETRTVEVPVELPSAGRGERVLLVDDEPSVVLAVGTLLRRAGYDVRTETDPTTVLALLTADPSSVDILVTDLSMPGMGGIELASRVTAVRPDLPIVLATGWDQGLSPDQLRKLGIRALIQKPYTSHRLAVVLSSVLHGHNSMPPIASGDGPAVH